MAQKKTVFERLEDKMIELQQNIETQLTNIQESIKNLKDEIPKSIGQSLMSFSDIIGSKVEDIEDALKNIGASGGSSPSTSTLPTLQNDLNDIKASIKNLQGAIQNIKIEATPFATHPPTSPAKPPQAPPPTPAAPAPSTPSAVPLSQPAPPPSSPSEGSMPDVLNLLDTIKQKAKSGLSGVQLASEMEQIRDTIVKVFRWHPALYELATFARRLKKYPKGTAPDTEILNLLLEKVEEWKNRISG